MPRVGLHHAVLPLLLLTSAAVLLAGCRQNSGGPAKATLAELVAEQTDYEGRRVETSGVVRRFGAAEGATKLHYVVEDRESNRVSIVPNDVAERYTGQHVTVVGAFRFSEQDGRSITIEAITSRR